jgi:LPPG:FO 2-phospho-L-lactate transferase
MSATRAETVVALCGGVGGAKLAFGLDALLGERLSLVVNTGDDFEHLGLAISPDVDTVLYTLGGRADRARGWGRADETWNFMAALGELGGQTWFNLGDRDLALHVARTQALGAGRRLTEFVADAARRFGIAARVLPMSDDPVRTMVKTDEGELPFQRYFVERRCAPVLRGLSFDGAERAQPSPEIVQALQAENLRAVIICPSNPYLSVDPILAMPWLSKLLQRAAAPIVAVSPLIGGAAVKGPTAKIMAELRIPTTSAAIADHYRGLLDGLVIDERDADDKQGLALPVRVAQTLMTTDADRIALARETLAFALSLPRRGAR